MASRVDVSGIQLETYDSIFGSSTTVRTEPLSNLKSYNIQLNDIVPFSEHTFKVVDDESMDKLVESIAVRGVMNPGIVRPLGNGKYEMISGHRRKRACEKLGFLQMPVYIISMSDDEAKICMVDSNLTQRDTILPSEKAKSYRMKFEAVKHQGTRRGGLTASIISEAYGDSMSTVKRFIKISYLNDKLLEMLDIGILGTETAYEIAFLRVDYQEIVWMVINDIGTKITKPQAVKLHEMSDRNEICMQSVKELLTAKKTYKSKIVLKSDLLSKYFDSDYSEDQIKDILISLLDKWKGGMSNG